MKLKFLERDLNKIPNSFPSSVDRAKEEEGKEVEFC